MRKLILCSLAAVSLAGVGHAAAAVGESAGGMNVHAEGINTVLGGKIPQVQVPAVQAFFNGSTLEGARLSPVAARSAAGFEAVKGGEADLFSGEGSDSGSMLLAGALVVVALVLRRIS